MHDSLKSVGCDALIISGVEPERYWSHHERTRLLLLVVTG
jgi:hypothetical protein